LALKIAVERKGAMQSVRVVLASLVSLVGILLAMGEAQVVDKRALATDTAKQGMATAVVKTWRVNLADSFGAGTPADSAPSQVTYIDSQKVAAAFGFPGVLFDAEGRRPNFAVHADRRVQPGEVEVHLLGTDVVYVVEGSATFVTGGTVVNPKTTAPNEITGTAIEGGETRHLSKGDVFIVPSGVPHWFKEVQGPLLYLLVKVRQESRNSL
jgi:mannose-6-phosphate isomerase-like protein (cupin superfamily)